MCHAYYDKDIWEWFGHSAEIIMLNHDYSKSSGYKQNTQLWYIPGPLLLTYSMDILLCSQIGFVHVRMGAAICSLVYRYKTSTPPMHVHTL